MKNKKLVIYGTGETAEIAADYFNKDSSYQVVAFTVDMEFQERSKINNIPVYEFENILNLFPPSKYEMFVAASFAKLNQVRTNMYKKAKSKGYKLANYISSRAFIWHNVKLGDNIFIFENNVIQYNAEIGNNVILWSGNHVGHQTIIEDNCFVSSHVVISGFCKIRKNCFIGVNSSFNDGIDFAKNSITGNSTVIVKNTDPGQVYIGNPAKSIKSSYEAFNINENEVA